jgi:hypothetical protein
MDSIFHYGRGLFFFFDADGICASTRNRILQHIIRVHRGVLGPEPKAMCLIDEFREELEQTRRSYPGIEHRQCCLWKTDHLIKERLLLALEGMRADPSEFVHKLLFGDRTHSAYIPMDPEVAEGVHGSYVSSELVKEGAAVLRALDAEDLVWNWPDLKAWRSIYIEAAMHGEVICTNYG